MSTVVLVGGGTASGKSMLSRHLGERLDALCIEHDRYYWDVPDPSRHNYDHPSALDTDLLVDQLATLRAGGRVPLPIYEFQTHTRSAAVEWADPTPIIVVEGILVLHDDRLCALADVRIFVDAPADVRLARRLRRDLSKRGRTVDSVLHQYFDTVRPMHQRFVEPSRSRAQLVLSGEAPIERLVERVVAALPSS